MKTTRTKKLGLTKDTVRDLSAAQLRSAAGGALVSANYRCIGGNTYTWSGGWSDTDHDTEHDTDHAPRISDG
jgi:hypothetical protein